MKIVGKIILLLTPILLVVIVPIIEQSIREYIPDFDARLKHTADIVATMFLALFLPSLIAILMNSILVKFEIEKPQYRILIRVTYGLVGILIWLVSLVIYVAKNAW